MAHDRSGPDAIILVRHLAETGKFKDVVAIEAALIQRGWGAYIDKLDDIVLRAELNGMCTTAWATQKADKR